MSTIKMPDGKEYPSDTPRDFNCDSCGDSILFNDTFWTFPPAHECGDINVETHFHKRCLNEKQKVACEKFLIEYARKNPDDWTINKDWKKKHNIE